MEPTNKLRPAAYASGTISIGSWLARVNRISTDNTAILAQIAKKKLYVYYFLRIHQQPKYEMARNLV
jgi:hypothetical protein